MSSQLVVPSLPMVLQGLSALAHIKRLSGNDFRCCFGDDDVPQLGIEGPGVLKKCWSLTKKGCTVTLIEKSQPSPAV